MGLLSKKPASGPGLSAMAEQVLERVTALGVTVHSVSRLGKMQSVLKDVIADGFFQLPDDDPRFPIALEALRDVQQLWLALRQFHRSEDSEALRRIIKRVVLDPIHPQDSPDNSFGRDAQFELFAAAMADAAGLRPQLGVEPDFQCSHHGRQLGVAVKRIKNLDRLEQRIRQAADQILETGIGGLIAIDITHALNPENRPLSHLRSEAAAKANVLRLRDHISRRYGKMIKEVTRGHMVHGVFFHDLQLCEHLNRVWWLRASVFAFPTSDHERRLRELEEFYYRYVKGFQLPTDFV